MSLSFNERARHNESVSSRLSWILRLGLIFGFGLTCAAVPPTGGARLAADLAAALQQLPAGQTIAVIAELSAAAPAPVPARLRELEAQGRVRAVTPLWIVNAVGFAADAATVRLVAGWPEVRGVTLDAMIPLPEAPRGQPAPASAADLQAVAPNLAAVQAPLLWSQGITGTGVVVASLDSGVDGAHPELAARWRGGASDWFDPYQQCAAPCDFSGHGTQVMGVILGGADSGTALGLAPGARWIAARIFGANNQAPASVIHQAFQWALDPDGDPATDDAPDVVNASWDLLNPGGCDLTFAPDLEALAAAGIIAVFAAGNSGPGPASAVSPANNPPALPVGAVDNAGQVASFSSRGPTSCGGADRLFPELAAPGVQVPTTDRMVAGDPAARYTQASGTSLAAPHVTGALALLLSAFPGQPPSAAELRVALSYTARPLPDSASAPNPDTGAGLLDVSAAYNALLSGALPSATPSATPSPTRTPGPTGTPTATPTPPATATPVWGFSEVSLYLPWVALGRP